MIEFQSDFERRLWCRLYTRLFDQGEYEPDWTGELCDLAVEEFRKREKAPGREGGVPARGNEGHKPSVS